MTISNEAVEAAAKAIAGEYWQTAMDGARAALEAAAPFIRAEALEDAADDLGHPTVAQWLRARAAEMRQG